MRMLTIVPALLWAVCAVQASAQDQSGPEDLPPLAQAVLDSAIALELAELPGHPITLEDAQAIAQQGATRIRIARAEAEAALGQVRSRKGAYDPELYGDLERSSDEVPTAFFFAGADVLMLDSTTGEAGVLSLIHI